MELFGLDENFNLVGQLDPYNIQWTRKYYECGQFEIEISPEQYDSSMKYVYTKDRPELGIIQKPHWSADVNGETMNLSGYFYEKILDDDVIYPTYYANGTLNEIIKGLIDGYCEATFTLDLSETASLTTKIEFQETGEELGTRLYELMSLYECSYRIEYDFENNLFTFKTYIGKDVTQSNDDGNNFVTFSTSWQNLQEPDVLIDETDYKNYAYVAGEGESEERIYVEVDARSSTKEKKKILFVDSRSSRWKSSEQTLEEYKNGLTQKGLEKLAENVITENIDFTIQSGTYEYLTDYDIGYKCEAIIDSLGLDIQGRIIAIYEVYKADGNSIEIELGDQLVSDVTKLERKLIL